MSEDAEKRRTVEELPRVQKQWLYGLTFEKVEALKGNNRWAYWLGQSEDPPADFVRWDGRDVLLPVEAERHPHLHVRSALSPDEDLLFLLVTDDNRAPGAPLTDAVSWTTYLALCVRVACDWYVAVLFHEISLNVEAIEAALAGLARP